MIHTCNTGKEKILNEVNESKIYYNNWKNFNSNMASLTPNFLGNFASANNFEINCGKRYF